MYPLVHARIAFIYFCKFMQWLCLEAVLHAVDFSLTAGPLSLIVAGSVCFGVLLPTQFCLFSSGCVGPEPIMSWVMLPG